MKFLKPKFWSYSEISFLAILLFPFAIFYKLLFFLKKIFSKEYSFSVPIICVGNIYLGGTGKTPICIELFKILKKLKKKPSFIRKQYKSFQDEIVLLKKVGPIYESKERSEAINNAIKNESDIDSITALSGSGPAYFFLFMEAMQEAAQEFGLSKELAESLIFNTAIGAAELAKNSEHSTAELRERVTSPGGTTQHAISVFESGDLKKLVHVALRAARNRSIELSQDDK